MDTLDRTPQGNKNGCEARDPVCRDYIVLRGDRAGGNDAVQRIVCGQDYLHFDSLILAGIAHKACDIV